MPIVKSVDLKWNRKALGEIDERYKVAILKLGYMISERAQMNAPVVTSALRNSIRVEESPDKTAILVKAGGIVSSGIDSKGRKIKRYVDYAWKVEQQSSRPHYMERAQREVMQSDWIKECFKGITR